MLLSDVSLRHNAEVIEFREERNVSIKHSSDISWSKRLVLLASEII